MSAFLQETGGEVRSNPAVGGRMSQEPEGVALGRLIREARNKKGLSQGVVGRAVGTEQQTVAKIEAGHSGVRSPFLRPILDFLEIGREAAALAAAESTQAPAFKRSQPIERGRRLGNELPIYRADELAGGEITLGVEPVEYRALPLWFAQIPSGYAIYMAGMSMYPEIKPGDTFIVNPTRPATLQHAHVFRHADEASGRAIVGILLRMDALNWYVQQWNVNDDVVLKRSDWPKAHMVTIKSTDPI
jgi:transcriptional regulator with XRE-family HTH domain